MEIKEAVVALAALAHESRLRVYRHLVEAGPQGDTPGEMAARLALAPSTLSFHLKELASSGLVTSRAASRYLVYSADFERMALLMSFLTRNCCQGMPAECLATMQSALSQCPAVAAPEKGAMADKPSHVLFLCTGNSARSILAESILNASDPVRFRGFSAGSHPAGRVNPFAIELLAKNRFPIEKLRSKNWEEFAAPGAPSLDYVFTVCDNAAGEVCPVWPGQPVTAHWALADPAAVEGTDEERRKAFLEAFVVLKRRIELFTSLPFAKLDKLALQSRLHAIGKA